MAKTVRGKRIAADEGKARITFTRNKPDEEGSAHGRCKLTAYDANLLVGAELIKEGVTPRIMVEFIHHKELGPAFLIYHDPNASNGLVYEHPRPSKKTGIMNNEGGYPYTIQIPRRLVLRAGLSDLYTQAVKTKIWWREPDGNGCDHYGILLPCHQLRMDAKDAPIPSNHNGKHPQTREAEDMAAKARQARGEEQAPAEEIGGVRPEYPPETEPEKVEETLKPLRHSSKDVIHLSPTGVTALDVFLREYLENRIRTSKMARAWRKFFDNLEDKLMREGK